MAGFPSARASKMGNVIVNPGSSDPGAVETVLREPRWWILDMGALWDFPALRGGADQNAILPGQEGRFGLEQILDQGTYVTGIRVTGESDASGVSPSGVSETRFFTQLRANLDWLYANVHTPPDSGATRSARLVFPDGSTVDFDGQFSLTGVAQSIIDAAMMLDITVPAGRIG